MRKVILNANGIKENEHNWTNRMYRRVTMMMTKQKDD